MDISHAYDDIIELPHHVSETHARMSLLNRAAQFSPFAALTGYEEAVAETARLTETRLELDEEQKQRINAGLRLLAERVRDRPEAAVVYFLPDERKEGGAYRSVRERVKKVDDCAGLLCLADGRRIPFEDIYSLELPSSPERPAP